MKNREIYKLSLAAIAINFILLGLTFYVTCLALSVNPGANTLMLTVVYSGVIMVSVMLGKQLLASVLSSLNTVFQLMLNNATGLLIGTSVMLILGKFIPGFKEFSAEIIIASVMAFFVLGTLLPLTGVEKRLHS